MPKFYFCTSVQKILDFKWVIICECIYRSDHAVPYNHFCIYSIKWSCLPPYFRQFTVSISNCHYTDLRNECLYILTRCIVNILKGSQSQHDADVFCSLTKSNSQQNFEIQALGHNGRIIVVPISKLLFANWFCRVRLQKEIYLKLTSGQLKEWLANWNPDAFLLMRKEEM